MPAPVINQRYTVGASDWVPIAAPQSCSYVHVQNEDGSINVTMRTDKDNSGTSRTLYPLQNFTFGSAQVSFEPGVTIIWVLAASGSVNVVATFVR